MSKNDAFIIALAYPDTVVRLSDEKALSYLRYIKVGCENYIRAGHAALILIHKGTGSLEYFDFGRYTCPQGYGRVRGAKTDHELAFPLKATVENDRISNLNEILTFAATHPELTHGEGKLVASVCSSINYESAKAYIMGLQCRNFVKYAAFLKNSTNCSRFVTDTLINSITDSKKQNQLIKLKRFTPSTVSNVVLADTENKVYEISAFGEVSKFTSTAWAEKQRCFFDSLKHYKPNLIGNLKPRYLDDIAKHAQWLEGIGAGAWFEITESGSKTEFRVRRISPYGRVDCDGIFKITSNGFDINSKYQFLHHSNCLVIHIEQNSKQFRFDFVKKYTSNSEQKAHLI